MLFFADGRTDREINDHESADYVQQLIDRLAATKPLSRVLLLPPDFTRFHSGSGPLTVELYRRLTARGCETIVMPALGTHFPMESGEREEMFPGIPASAFRDHHFRNEVVSLGELPASRLAELSEGRVEFPVQVQINRRLVEEKWDAIISIGQLVPHEVIGIANHVKNVCVGVGGFDLINKSHWLGAVYGMERIMGRAVSPVRTLLNDAAKTFLGSLPIQYLLTVRQRTQDGRLVTRGLYAGDDDECFLSGAELCRRVNLDIVEKAPRKCVVFLDPQEFKSTWLGNKAIYRTRMMMADAGELIILAPGVKQFGEDREIDRLIRKYGYHGTPATLQSVKEHPELAANLSAAAHLIHGSSEGRFRIRYAPGHLTKAEVESAGFEYGDLSELMAAYDPHRMIDGWNRVNGEDVFFVSNPALGLWGTAERFGQQA
ncbi:MAG: lactate racemase domain-containing protein [Gemmataceae bacterium]